MKNYHFDSFCKFGYKHKQMDAIKQLRKEVKEYIDAADAKVVKMVHAMLEAEKETDWLENEAVLSIVAERSAEYKSGKIKAIPWDRAKKQILSSAKKKGKK